MWLYHNLGPASLVFSWAAGGGGVNTIMNITTAVSSSIDLTPKGDENRAKNIKVQRAATLLKSGQLTRYMNLICTPSGWSEVMRTRQVLKHGQLRSTKTRSAQKYWNTEVLKHGQLRSTESLWPQIQQQSAQVINFIMLRSAVYRDFKCLSVTCWLYKSFCLSHSQKL